MDLLRLFFALQYDLRHYRCSTYQENVITGHTVQIQKSHDIAFEIN